MRSFLLAFVLVLASSSISVTPAADLRIPPRLVHLRLPVAHPKPDVECFGDGTDAVRCTLTPKPQKIGEPLQ